MKKLWDLYKKHWIAYSIILFIVILIIFVFFSNRAPKVYYETSPAENGKITAKVEASGTINPVGQTNVGTQVSGTIEKLYVDYNTPVKKGDILAEIDPATLQAQVVSQQASLMKAESTLKNDERSYERYKQLYKQNFVAKSDLDSAETTYLSSKASYIQAKANLDKAETDLSYTKIFSPVDGIIISRDVDIGQTVASSFQTPTLFIVAQDLTKMQIEVKVSEADIINVKEGQDVIFFIDGYPNEEFKGNVSQVRLSAETVQGMVAYTVVIGVDNHDLRLKPGMTANVTIITQVKDDVLLVPNSALRYIPKESTQRYRNQGIWVLNNNMPERVEVQTGIMDDYKAEIVSGGLKAGDKVILSETTDSKAAKSLFGAGPPSRSARNQERQQQQQRRQ